MIDLSKSESHNRYRKIDMLGKRIELTYMGENGFRTILGSIVSTLIYIFIILYLIFLLIKVLKKSDITLTQNSIFRDLSIDKSEHFFNKNTPNISLRWVYPNNTYVPISVGYLRMYENHHFMNPDSTYSNTSYFNNVSIWTPELFPLGEQVENFYLGYYYKLF